MEGPELDELEELELAPEGKHWKSIVNNEGPRSVIEKDIAQIRIERRFWNQAAGSSLSTYTTGVVTQDDP